MKILANNIKNPPNKTLNKDSSRTHRPKRITNRVCKRLKLTTLHLSRESFVSSPSPGTGIVLRYGHNHFPRSPPRPCVSAGRHFISDFRNYRKLHSNRSISFYRVVTFPWVAGIEMFDTGSSRCQ